MSLTLTAWAAWQCASISAVKRNRARRTKAGESAPPSTANYVMNHVAVGSTLDGDFNRFAMMVGGRQAETFFLRCLQHAALHGAMTGKIEEEPHEFGPYILTRRWNRVCLHEGIVVHDALIHSGIATSDGEPHTYADPFTCEDHVPCRCVDRVPHNCTDSCPHPLLLPPSLTPSVGVGAPPLAPTTEEGVKKTEPAPSPSTAGGGTSASDSTGSQHWQASKPEDVDPFTPVMMKLLNRLNGASSGRRDTLQALIDTPPDQRANGWFEKVAVQVSADPDDLVALVYPPEQEEA